MWKHSTAASWICYPDSNLFLMLSCISACESPANCSGSNHGSVWTVMTDLSLLVTKGQTGISGVGGKITKALSLKNSPLNFFWSVQHGWSGVEGLGWASASSTEIRGSCEYSILGTSHLFKIKYYESRRLIWGTRMHGVTSSFWCRAFSW